MDELRPDQNTRPVEAQIAVSTITHGSEARAGPACKMVIALVKGTLVDAKSAVWKQRVESEFFTPERCHIIETYNSAADEACSVARARVQRGVTTAWHQVEGTVERYIMAQGRGRVEVGNFPAEDVGPGDVVIIPAGVRQRISNIGDEDLIFFCVCTPRFQPQNYRALE